MGQLLWGGDTSVETEEISENLKNFSQMIEEDPWRAGCFLLNNWPKDEKEKGPFVKVALDNMPLIVEKDAEVAKQTVESLLNCDLLEKIEILPVVLNNLHNLVTENVFEAREVMEKLLSTDTKQHPEVVEKICGCLPLVSKKEPGEALDVMKVLLKEDTDKHSSIIPAIFKALPILIERESYEVTYLFDHFVKNDLAGKAEVIKAFANLFPFWIETEYDDALSVLDKIVLDKISDNDLAVLYQAIFSKADEFEYSEVNSDEVGELAFGLASVDSRVQKFERGMLCDTFAVSIKSPGSKRNTLIIEDLENKGTARVYAGCFAGTVEEFEKAVSETYGDGESTECRKHYEGVIQLAKAYEAKLQKRAIK